MILSSRRLILKKTRKEVTRSTIMIAVVFQARFVTGLLTVHGGTSCVCTAVHNKSIDWGRARDMCTEIYHQSYTNMNPDYNEGLQKRQLTKERKENTELKLPCNQYMQSRRRNWAAINLFPPLVGRCSLQAIVEKKSFDVLNVLLISKQVKNLYKRTPIR